MGRVGTGRQTRRRGEGWRRAVQVALAGALAMGAWRLGSATVPAVGYTQGRVEVRMALLLLQSADTYTYAVRHPFALPLIAHSPLKPPEYSFVNSLAPATASDDGLVSELWYPSLGTSLTSRMPGYWVVRHDPTRNAPDLSLFDLLIIDEGRPVDLGLLGNLRPTLEAYVRNGGVLWINNWGETTLLNAGRNLSVTVRRQRSREAPSAPATTQPKRAWNPRHPLLWGETLLAGEELDALGQGVANTEWNGLLPDGFINDRSPDGQQQPVVVTEQFDQTRGVWQLVEGVSAARVGNGVVVVTAGNVLGRIQDWFVPFLSNFTDPDADLQQLPPYEVAGALKFAYSLVKEGFAWRGLGGWAAA